MKSIIIHHQDQLEPNVNTLLPDPHQDTFSKTILGFWLYLMTDCLLFGTLFATYAVLHHETFGGPSSKDLFSVSLAFTETMILLLSSVTCGFGMLAALKNRPSHVISWLLVSFLLGGSFIALELHEFIHMVSEGHSWSKSAFLSSFSTLVGTHGLHVFLDWFG